MALAFLLITQSTLLVLCTGVPFVLNLAWWIIGYSLYFGFAIPVVLQGIEAIKEENDYGPVPITRSFLMVRPTYFGIQWCFSLDRT